MPRVKLLSMKSRDENRNRMKHAFNENTNANASEDQTIGIHNVSSNGTGSTFTASTFAASTQSDTITTTAAIARQYHSTKIQLLMSSKFTHGRGFTDLSVFELGLVQILAEFEHNNGEWNQNRRSYDRNDIYSRQSFSPTRSPTRSHRSSDPSYSPTSRHYTSRSRSATPYRGREKKNTNIKTNSPSSSPIFRPRREVNPPNSPIRSPTRQIYKHNYTPQISSQQIAHAIIDALFKRDFDAGPDWEIDPSIVQKIKPSHTLLKSNAIRQGGSNSGSNTMSSSENKEKNKSINDSVREWGEEVYRAEKRATWDSKEPDFYAVAMAKGTIRFLPRIHEIRVESYIYYVAG